ncbi:Penicillin-binding protein activator LpoA [hydrothermal vent metagenome]|uniref:Penicillin-binding protein activator LpoA n=1 Tax=hydrothermal vent metagenome TaxID=652676 RepID=A0A3B0WP04_9ZZZZ
MKSHTLKLFLLACIISLSACDTQPTKPDQTATKDSRPTTEEQATLTDEAEQWLTSAENSDNHSEQIKYRALAARYYLEAGKTDPAQRQLDIIKLTAGSVTDGTNKAAISLLSADIAIHKKNAVLASQILSASSPISRDQQLYFYALKADLDYLSGKYMFTVDRRVQLDTYILDKKDKNRNHKKIWIALSTLSTTQLNNQYSSNPVIRGWLDLAKVMRSGQQNISKLEDDLLDWGTRYPSHPVGEMFLSELIDNYQAYTKDTKHIAVLLPMNGNLSSISNSIKNGFLSAYYNDTNTTTKPVLSFYDSSDESQSFRQLYERAIDSGATNIIGPLDKVSINQLTQQRELDIPVLTLNYAENNFNNTENLFQFGLSPEDEARQVAELVIRQNKLRAAVFYPDSKWGERLNKAFSEHYESLGGRVLTVKNYATSSNDYRRPIRTLFNLDQSDIRRRKVENTISERAQSEPYRRQDIDMVFLAATHHSARGIMPAFKFHHAGDLPVYSTSHVYTGKINRDLDRDLDGLTFCDLPWILQNHSPLANVFSKNWPEQQSLTRLYALGIDAYHLVYNLDYLNKNSYAFYDGQTGNIQLDENNRVTRKLLWAQFKSGRPVYFEPVLPELADLTHTETEAETETEN